MKAIVLLCSLLPEIALSSDSIQLYTENFKPYQYLDGDQKLRGFGIELIERLFLEAEVAINGEIRMAIWNNAYHQALQKNNTGIFMTVRNDKREKLFKWVGPLAPRKMWLYKLKSRTDIQANSLDDAKKYTIGTYKSAQSDYLTELKFPNLDIVLKEELNINKLLAGRIDLMPSSEILIVHKLRDLNLPIQTVEKVIVFDDRYEYYLALNSQVDDSTVVRLQSALDGLKNNGTYTQIESKYID